MPWWQRQRLERQQEAAVAGQGYSAAQQQQGRRGQQQPAYAAEPSGEAAPEEVHIPAEVSVIKLAALLGRSVLAAPGPFCSLLNVCMELCFWCTYQLQPRLLHHWF